VHYIRRLNPLLFEAYYDICLKPLQTALQIIFTILDYLFYCVAVKLLYTYDPVILNGVENFFYTALWWLPRDKAYYMHALYMKIFLAV